MHRPSNFPVFRAIYSRHTMMHHQFFTEQEMRFADHHDWRVTFFPPYALVVFTFMSIPPAIVAGLVDLAECRLALITTTTSMYLIYEFMHFCCHVDENGSCAIMPFVNTIRRHHTAHHNQSIMMERNMNLTFPIMDCLMGTSDLNRGVLGPCLQRLRHALCQNRHAQDRADAARDARGSARGVGRNARGAVPPRFGVSPLNHLEPNMVALSWFTLLWSVCCLGVLPARRHVSAARGATARAIAVLLVLGNTALWLALLAGTLAFASCRAALDDDRGRRRPRCSCSSPNCSRRSRPVLRDGRAGLAIAGCILDRQRSVCWPGFRP